MCAGMCVIMYVYVCVRQHASVGNLYMCEHLSLVSVCVCVCVCNIYM